MQALSTLESRVLQLLLHGQPLTPAKVTFAWRLVAGPTLAAVTTVDTRSGGVLHIRASADTWRRELRRVRPLLLARLQDLLGADVIRRIVIDPQ